MREYLDKQKISDGLELGKEDVDETGDGVVIEVGLLDPDVVRGELGALGRFPEIEISGQYLVCQDMLYPLRNQLCLGIIIHYPFFIIN